MVSYTLVREYREGRQKEHETAHLIKGDDDETICGHLRTEESRSVRNIGTFLDHKMLCSECSEVATNIA